jgi:hypothetical protein
VLGILTLKEGDGRRERDKKATTSNQLRVTPHAA